MISKLIDGKKISSSIHELLEKQISEIKSKYFKAPKLVVILVGSNPASISYVKAKEKACKKAGIICHVERLEENVTEKDLIKYINDLNYDIETDGMIVQLPLPKKLDEEKIIQSISPQKDVDGLTNENLGLLASGQPRFVPATPLGVQKLLDEIGIKTEGKNIVIIGRSKLVGIPLALLLSAKSDLGNATVTICHSKSNNIDSLTLKADIVIVATGFPSTLTKKMVKENSIVIDVGVNRIEDSSKKNGYRLIGDSDFEEIIDIVSKITPVPGGVGPMTIAMLLSNVTKAFIINNDIKNL
ncbi:MAG: bifunctional 5,10-methylene-tetrahydrofolate dehydrogenase/5,10-methylene-tetrahydrofolate cyclohydrolase [Dehalococcoidales bacterium]|jgi:methylenetetrahydrofolate dehydrogenase (NADP+) / methenyltetrahydrofolate cyclohydrolase|nr:bifunctional 5,10-methylenetetrahydrofolate dehydrogenase/5,10-methenyltetrahydrofolate cyclohydrolase [Dehalococcoidia bacterium]NCG34599.1 bifunctional 5,10-methylene-tetrahydrofolate dehydrogenase/5,10-methylene-tetrahydrofolate cyclohydrolase [Dehalococcoidales bacterium]